MHGAVRVKVKTILLTGRKPATTNNKKILRSLVSSIKLCIRKSRVVV